MNFNGGGSGPLRTLFLKLPVLLVQTTMARLVLWAEHARCGWIGVHHRHRPAANSVDSQIWPHLRCGPYVTVTGFVGKLLTCHTPT